MHYQTLLRNLLREVVFLAWERLGLVLADKLASIVFPLLIRTIHDEVTHVPTIVASPHTLALAFRAT